MKKLLYRKLFLDYMSFFFIALICSSLIIWIFQAVNFLDIMVEDGREYKVYLSYSLLNFPKIISRLLPFILFFSIYYVLVKYENNNELIIFWNFGEDKINFVNFIIRSSLFLFLFQIILTSLVVPKSQDLAKSFLRNSNVNFIGSFIKPKRFNDTIKGVTIYSENKDSDGYLYNLYIKKNISGGFELTYAKKGIFDQSKSIPVIVLFDGETVTNKNNKVTNISFAKSDFLLSNLKANTMTEQKNQELRTSHVMSCILFLNKINLSYFKKIQKTKLINCTEGNKINLIKELYKRLVIPFYIPILMLIPYLLILTSKEKSNYNKMKLFSFLTGVFVIIFSEGTIRFVSKEINENIFISIIPLILFTIFYLLFFYKLKLKSLN
ncbi:LptF/LptG family permease [Pelagibacterales bacterium SAG-MED18]|nr:LptF/LptG family permease [Pelagibacterales bacterium SAG-MED18]